ncbi:MAG TPA: cytochrome c-type biogenesis CcmF C-terminal domain-containing protein, partial [Pyrinomonadaceae bacterium]|nr:cytochrome c-type biogenesis CcmF C-terminal domain-containing protein [Pyrinomonadaceae bacterium]
ALLLPLVIGSWKPLVSLGLLLAIWIVVTAILNLRDRVKTTAGQLSLLRKLRMQSRSYYGMQLAHVGVAVFIVGVTLDTGNQAEQDVRMSTGDTVSVGGYDFRMNGVREVPGPNYRAVRAEIEVSRNGNVMRTMYPEKRSYLSSGNAMTETAIDTGIFRDLYISLGEAVGSNAWSVRVHYKPFVNWIWGGALLMALGGVLAVSDRRYALAARKERLSQQAAQREAVPALATASAEKS